MLEETIERCLIRIVAISDTHELHREVTIPPTDLLIHAGDFTFFSSGVGAVLDLNAWLGEQHTTLGKVVIPGNHDGCIANPICRSLIDEAAVLIGEPHSIGGLNIWGSPVTPLLGVDFGIVSPAKRAEHYAGIPTDTDILVTHGPPYGILDSPPEQGRHEGCLELLAAVQRIKPRLHIFGHVHTAYGIRVIDGTTFVNAALLGPDGDIAHLPLVFDIQPTPRWRQK